MGLYMEVESNTGKAELIKKLDDRVQPVCTHLVSFKKCPKGFLPVCVVDNVFFEAAGVAYSEDEFNEFNHYRDTRPKQWLYVPIEVIRQHAPGAGAYLDG